MEWRRSAAGVSRQLRSIRWTFPLGILPRRPRSVRAGAVAASTRVRVRHSPATSLSLLCGVLLLLLHLFRFMRSPLLLLLL